MMDKRTGSTQGGNPFYERVKGYVGKQVSVALKSQKKLIEGKLSAVNFATLNFVIESNDGFDYILRDDIAFIMVKR